MQQRATWQYFTLDHLGSVAVVTNASGTVIERDSYNALRMASGVLRSKRSTGAFRSPVANRSSRGRRRNSNGTDNTSCSITSGTTRGYTGHEEMDGICEVNANARIYDPTIGRFMSADTIIPEFRGHYT